MLAITAITLNINITPFFLTKHYAMRRKQASKQASKQAEYTNSFDERKNNWQIIFTPAEKRSTHLRIKHGRSFACIKSDIHRIIAEKKEEFTFDNMPDERKLTMQQDLKLANLTFDDTQRVIQKVIQASGVSLPDSLAILEKDQKNYLLTHAYQRRQRACRCTTANPIILLGRRQRMEKSPGRTQST